MLGRNISELWPSISKERSILARHYVELGYEIFTGKIVAQPEHFNGQYIEPLLQEQAATLMRFAITIDPNCDMAMFYLGYLTLVHNIQARLSDNVGELLWSTNRNLKAAVYFRRAFEKNSLNILALNEVAILILARNIVANKNDFNDKVVPSESIEEQGAKILRHIRTINFNHPKAICNLARLICTEAIVASQEDFGDEEMPDNPLMQAVKLYRLALAHDKDSTYANAQLGTFISNGFIEAIPSDFSSATMPATVSEQAAQLFRRALLGNDSCWDSLVGMARLISTRQLIPTEEDCKLLNFSASISAGEQAAVLYRKAINLNKTGYAAKLELAELIFQRKVLPTVGDYPGYSKTLTPLSWHLEFMLTGISVKPECDQVKDLLERVKIKERQDFLTTLERETNARREREEKSYQERKAAELAAQLLKSNKAFYASLSSSSSSSSSSTKRKPSVPSQVDPVSNLFKANNEGSADKKRRVEETKVPEVKHVLGR